MARNLHDMTLTEIEAVIWKDRGVSEPVGLRDVFTDDEIIDGLMSHPCYNEWPNHFKDWVYNAFDVITTQSFV